MTPYFDIARIQTSRMLLQVLTQVCVLKIQGIACFHDRTCILNRPSFSTRALTTNSKTKVSVSFVCMMSCSVMMLACFSAFKSDAKKWKTTLDVYLKKRTFSDGKNRPKRDQLNPLES